MDPPFPPELLSGVSVMLRKKHMAQSDLGIHYSAPGFLHRNMSVSAMAVIIHRTYTT